MGAEENHPSIGTTSLIEVVKLFISARDASMHSIETFTATMDLKYGATRQ